MILYTQNNVQYNQGTYENGAAACAMSQEKDKK
jgi:hypothetical protein